MDSVERVIKEIIGSIRGKEIIVFCGAGISRNSGLPVVGQLVLYILNKLETPEAHKNLFVDAGGNLKEIPFEAFIEILHGNSDTGSIYEIFDADKPKPDSIKPNRNHIFLSKLIKQHNLKTIVTTNFDQLIEKALAEEPNSMIARKDYDVLYKEEDFENVNWDNDRVRIIKIHGSIEDKENMAITMEQIANKQISTKRKAVIDYVFSSGGHKTVLVLNYSCSDVFDISPFIEGIEKDRKRVFLLEHVGGPKIEEIGTQETKNPFTEYSGQRLYYDTDKFIRKLWGELIPEDENCGSPKEEVPWKKNIDDWYNVMNARWETNKYNILGQIFFSISQFPVAIGYFEQCLKVVRGGNARGEEQAALHHLGNAYHQLGEFTKSIDYQKKSLEIAHEIKDTYGVGSCLGGLGIVYNEQGDFQTAMKHFEASLKIFQDIGAKKDEGLTFANMGIACDCLGDYQSALHNHKKSLEIAQKTGNKTGEGDASANLGNVYHFLGNHQEAKSCFEASLKIFRDIGNKTREGMAYGGMGIACDCLGDYQSALHNHKKSLEIAQKTENKMAEGNTFVNLGIVCDHLGQYEEAKKNYENALVILRPLLGDYHPFVGNVETAYRELVNRSIFRTPHSFRKQGDVSINHKKDVLYKENLAKTSTMYAAINVGYSLGYLASTYAPWIPNYTNAEMARENYTLLVEADVQFLGGTLSPSPTQLIESGRGNSQYTVIESYFGQINKIAQQHSECIQSVVGMSLASGWLILNTFEAEQLFAGPNVNADLLRDFKKHLTSRIEAFSALASTSVISCEKNQYPPKLSLMFHAIQEDSWAWKERTNSSKGREIIAELRMFRNYMDKWINGAMGIVGPNTY